MRVFIGLLIFFLTAQGKSHAGPANPVYERNIREGFAATAGFEIVTIDRVPRGKIVTYRLDPNPDAYKVRGEGLSHIKWVTLEWKESREVSPFVFDLYLHGDRQFDDPLAIRVAQVDIRKFLHQSVRSFSDDFALAQLQAYFEEFARKAKIIYRLPFKNSDKTDRDLSYEDRLLNEIKEGISPLLNSLNKDTSERESLSRADDQLETKSANLSQVYQNLQAVALKHSAGGPAEALAASLLQKVAILALAQKITDITITNNCREPGNYELEIRDSNGRYLLRANFSFPTKDYDLFLTRYHGVGIADQGTGIGVPSTIRNKEKLRYWDSFLPWKRMKSFPKVKIDALSELHLKRSVEGEGATRAPLKGEINVIQGRIPFENYQYDMEVTSKGKLHLPGPEPLSYVRVDPRLSLPAGFESPDKSQPASYWRSNAHAGKIVPYHFQTFEDIQRYDIYLSGFDLNGVYIGKSDLKAFDKERKKGRWHFNFQYLQNLNQFEFRERNELIEIRLVGAPLAAPSHKQAVNFIFGNFSVQVGKSVEFLLGLGPQPLISAYNHNPYQETLVYGFAYGAEGNILDHHDLGIGVEKIYIERVDAETYKVRLISYERILPVWEGLIRIPLLLKWQGVPA